jgi:hypothetical protein
MSYIVLGKSGAHNAKLDIDILLRTRLLIQANSGGGKSYLLRRIAEQLFGKVPVIIIDPEGEFATLREKFGFVLVGKGGETPADPRSAALVAHKLLELRASAVCDLYEMKPSERHRWVRLFAEAIVDAPKKLWRPTIFIVDEVHTFAPERGAGESEASEALIGMATRGRKRRFCSIWATQRLGKVRKDATAEFLNRLVGSTFEDVDLKRAAELLSIRPEDRREFDAEMRVLEPGNFYGLGRAIAKERILIHIGPVETSHEVEDAKYGDAPPPAPDEIQKLLPKLADLPKEAEEKAKTEAELRTEIRSLKAQLRSQPTHKIETKQPDNSQWNEIQRYKAGEAHHKKEFEDLLSITRQVVNGVGQLSVLASELARMRIPKRFNIPRSSNLPKVRVSSDDPPKPSPLPPLPKLEKFPPIERDASNGDLGGPEKKILRALSELRSIGKETPPKEMVAAWALYSPNGGAFVNPLGKLRTLGLVEYPAPGVVSLTASGLSTIGEIPPPDSEEIMRRLQSICSGPEWKILYALFKESGQEEVSRADLAMRSGYEVKGGAFVNPLGALRTKGILDYPRPGFVKAADWIFVE